MKFLSSSPAVAPHDSLLVWRAYINDRKLKRKMRYGGVRHGAVRIEKRAQSVGIDALTSFERLAASAMSSAVCCSLSVSARSGAYRRRSTVRIRWMRSFASVRASMFAATACPIVLSAAAASFFASDERSCRTNSPRGAPETASTSATSIFCCRTRQAPSAG